MTHLGDADEKYKQSHQNSSLPVSITTQYPSFAPAQGLRLQFNEHLTA